MDRSLGIVLAACLLALLPACAQTSGGVLFASQYCAQPGVLDQTCINAAGATATAGVHVVFIPAGTYVISSPVVFYSGVTYYGAGQGLTTLIEAPGANLARPFATQSGATAVTIQDLTIDGNEAHNTGGGQIELLDMDGATDSTLLRTTVQNFYGFVGQSGPCVGFSNLTADNLVQNNHIFNCGGPGRLSDAIYIGGTRNRVIGNLIDSAGDTGVVAETGVDEVISDNVIRNTPQPISVDGLIASSTAQGVAISGNTIDGANAANGAAIFIINVAGSQTRRIAVTGNVISGLTDGHGILVEDSSEVSIAGNVLSDISPTQSIFKSGIVAINSDQLVITGNSVRGASGSGMDIQGGTNVVIESNLLTNNGLVNGWGMVIENGTSFPGGAITHANGVCALTLDSPSYLASDDVVTVSASGGDPACLGQHTLATVNAGYTQVTYNVAGSGPSGGASLVTRNSSFVTINGNQAHGASQLYGLWVADASTEVFIEGNQLTGNAQVEGFLNTTKGQVQLGTNQLNASADSSTGGLAVTQGGISLANGIGIQSVTSGGMPVNLLVLTPDANNITRFMAGDDAGGFQWTNQAQSQSWMDLLASGLSIGGGARIASSGALAQFVGTITTTASASDSFPSSGVSSGSHCFAQAADATAASMTGTYVTVGPGTVTLNHAMVAGGIFNLFCSAQ